MKQVFEYYGDVKPFLRENDHLAPATCGHLLELFNNQNDAADLRLELAALIDGGVHFVTGTCNLEGDGPLVFMCYEHLSSIVNAISVGSFPNVEALARQRADGDQRLFNELIMQAKACINPGFRFFQQKFSNEFHSVVRAFRSARLCCPIQVQQLRPTAASVEELRNFSFLDDDATIASLVDELPCYLAKADGVQMTSESDKIAWWSSNSETLPHWSAVVKKVLLVQPNSAAAERVFSVMESLFNGQHDSAVEETVEASVMLSFNGSQQRKCKL